MNEKEQLADLRRLIGDLEVFRARSLKIKDKNYRIQPFVWNRGATIPVCQEPKACNVPEAAVRSAELKSRSWPPTQVQCPGLNDRTRCTAVLGVASQ